MQTFIIYHVIIITTHTLETSSNGRQTEDEEERARASYIHNCLVVKRKIINQFSLSLSFFSSEIYGCDARREKGEGKGDTERTFF
jgi:hypothetical protein